MAALVLPALVLGCMSEGDDGDLEIAKGEIVNGALTTSAPWIVRIDMPGTWCSASVLTEHWLLTAAHCVDDQPVLMPSLIVRFAEVEGGTQVVYNGPARPYGHPLYDILNPENDIALIKLEDAAGIDLTLTGRAKLWGYSKPWNSTNEADRRFIGMGWGRTGENECSDNTTALKRFSSDNLLDRADYNALTVRTPAGWRFACPGDSGSPWLFRRDGNLIAFAVDSYYLVDLLLIGGNNHGTLITPKLGWMYETSHYRDILDLLCSAPEGGGDVAFLECREQPATPPPPPPPGTSCPSGKYCCEPNPDGPACLMCVANNQYCP